MKTQLQETHSKLLGSVYATVIAAALLIHLPSSAQLVIEAGPNAVQISDQDGQVEVVRTPVINSTEPLQAVPGGPVTEIDETITVQPNQLESTTVNVPVEVEPRDPIANVKPIPNRTVVTEPSTTVVAAEPSGIPVPAAEVVVTPEIAARMAEIARELSIQNTAAGASLAMTTEGLFTEGTSAIDPLLEPQLSLIAEYIRLSENNMVEVTYHYLPDEAPEFLAWQRSLAFVNWMKTKGLTVNQVYTIADPEAVVVETPVKTNPVSVNDTELVGRLVLSMN